MNATLVCSPILNRENPTTPEWHILVPEAGVAPHDSGKAQVLDRAAILAMQRNFKAPVLVDQDHFSYDLTKPSEAYGWVTAVETRSNAPGLWGKIEWTDIGAAAVKNQRYKFLSPVWQLSDCENVGGNRIRPTRLDSLGLTNVPNIKVMPALMLNRAAGNGSGATAANFGPEDAAHLFASFVNREVRETGRRFEDAWRSMMGREPVLNFASQNVRDRRALSIAASLLPATPEEYAFNRFRNQVEELQHQHRLGFEAAWNMALQQMPAIAELSPLRNRRPSQGRISDGEAVALHSSIFNSVNATASANPHWRFGRVWTQLQAGPASLTHRILANRMKIGADELVTLCNRCTVPFGKLDAITTRYEKAAKKVFAHVFDEMVDVVPKSDWLLGARITSALKDIRREHPDWSYDQCWEEMKSRHLDLVQAMAATISCAKEEED